LVVVDSVAALTPLAELEGAMGDVTVGLQARMMGQAMRKLAGHVRAAGATVLFTNQPAARKGRRRLRAARDAARRAGAEVLRIPAARHQADRDAEGGRGGGRQPHASEGREEQVGGTFSPGRVRYRLGRGISQVGCVLDVAVQAGAVKRSGAFFAFGEERLGQGRAKAKVFLEERPELVAAISSHLRGNGVVLPREHPERSPHIISSRRTPEPLRPSSAACEASTT
jgi:recombination protein RecA